MLSLSLQRGLSMWLILARMGAGDLKDAVSPGPLGKPSGTREGQKPPALPTFMHYLRFFFLTELKFI